MATLYRLIAAAALGLSASSWAVGASVEEGARAATTTSSAARRAPLSPMRWQGPPRGAMQACAASAVWTGPSRRSAPDEVWRSDASRAIDGALDEGLQAVLDRALDGIVARAPAASVAVAVPGEGRWARTRGLARTAPRRAAGAGDRFQAASATKTFVAAAVLQLVEEGRLRLDQRIDAWFPDVPNAARTTVDHLLRHTSGLVSFNALPTWTLDYRTPQQAIDLAAAVPPQFCPGAGFAYTNTGYAMLGLIVEAIEGRPLHEVLAARFLQPLGLERTALRRVNDGLAVVSGHTSGRPVDAADNYATPYAAGGLASTAADLVTFWHALLAGRILPPATVRAMFTQMAAMGPEGRMFYGRGVQLYDIPDGPGLMLGHSGGITGFTSVVAYLPVDRLFVAVMLNDQQAPAEAGLWAIVRAVRGARTPR